MSGRNARPGAPKSSQPRLPLLPGTSSSSRGFVLGTSVGQTRFCSRPVAWHAAALLAGDKERAVLAADGAAVAAPRGNTDGQGRRAEARQRREGCCGQLGDAALLLLLLAPRQLHLGPWVLARKLPKVLVPAWVRGSPREK